MELPGAKIAVIGGAVCDDRERRLAWETGREIGRRAVLLCGGGGGVMAAAAEGARSVGGLTIGILPGVNAAASPPNPHIALALFTGLGQARNQVLVLSADAAVAVAGGWGTLNEIGLAMKHGIPVVRLASWRLEPPAGLDDSRLLTADGPAEAVTMALAAAGIETRA